MSFFLRGSNGGASCLGGTDNKANEILEKLATSSFPLYENNWKMLPVDDNQ
jgi:hypothetical protein